ncbi:DegT/DnrJ/EryC1/StrS aminotransferase family protein [Roseivirga sp. E12]|uniref:DegT/DnrJ/EryC1/StrS family aminotransferase n=1 Tax=Roseivirga sp. E12 TaxID=2819237 RepID=UPI001ABCE463|nr:DegT/DnrJ/EryC1/StrS family aminotransferase [Roseivirga sp. E12]MBO3699866.1 DegT/DnrJ/EryC1/StrS family aminotransferase [Roseivirga sp. E12]
MQVPFLDLSLIHEPIKNELEEVYRKVLRESQFINGSEVTTFENSFAEKCGVDHCIAVANCTDALYITLKMMGIGPGDEVLVPAMTWITDAEVVTQLKAKPVFVDIDPMSYTIDSGQIEGLINEKTKAIIPVHLYGQLANLEVIKSIANKHDLKVIEDCAQSHFAQKEGNMAGSFGDASVFSFYPSKNLGALGDAGCILTNNEELATRCRKLANHGGIGKDEHEFPGVNSRMDTLQASILSLKLQHIDGWTAERQRIANRYLSALHGVGDLTLPSLGDPSSHVFHIFIIQTATRDEIRAFLEERGIQTQVHYPKAIPFTKAYSQMGFGKSDFPHSYQLQENCLSLPIFPGLTEAQIDHVIDSINLFYKK